MPSKLINCLFPPRKRGYLVGISTVANKKSLIVVESNHRFVPLPQLTDRTLAHIIDYCTFFDLMRLRAVSNRFRRLVDDRLRCIDELRVRKCTMSTDDDDYCTWQRHPSAQLFVALPTRTSAIVIVDDRWTSRDVGMVWHTIGHLRRHLHHLIVDAPIAELIVVGLSMLQLNRWYAFLCYMKAFNVSPNDDDSADVQLLCEWSTAKRRSTPDDDVYLPQLRSLIIRCNGSRQSSHLSRIIDYGVRSNRVIDRQYLQELRIELIDDDTDHDTTTITRHLYHFRCWAGTVAFDERYSQLHIARLPSICT